MNELIYFPHLNLSVEQFTDITSELGYQARWSDDEITRIILNFQFNDQTESIWKIADFNVEEWEEDIPIILSRHSTNPTAVILVEFKPNVIKQITNFLKILLNKYAGIILPSVVDEFILTSQNLTEENMKLLYEKDYDDIL